MVVFAMLTDVCIVLCQIAQHQLSAATAISIFRSPAMMNIVMRQGWIALGVSIAAMVGSGMLVRSLPYESGFGAKQLAWMVHCGVLGAVVAPICLLGGPILTR